MKVIIIKNKIKKLFNKKFYVTIKKYWMQIL
jgi:hypothetical protein